MAQIFTTADQRSGIPNDFVAVTLSDSTILPSGVIGLIAQTLGGTAIVETAGGTTITINLVKDIPFSGVFRKVKTGGTATGIIAALA